MTYDQGKRPANAKALPVLRPASWCWRSRARASRPAGAVAGGGAGPPGLDRREVVTQASETRNTELGHRRPTSSGSRKPPLGLVGHPDLGPM